MPMTKAEKAEMEALRVRAALAWPAPPPAPVDVKMVADDDGVFRGWWVRRRRGVSDGVGEGVVVGNLHATHPYTAEQIANRYSGRSHVSLSQGQGGPWYFTKLDALRALHYALAQDAAETLAACERRIAEATDGL